MIILDIFSWLPAKELSLEEIEHLVLDLHNGQKEIDGFILKKELPEDAHDNAICVTYDLINEGKNVCYLFKGGSIIAAIGYREA